LHVSGHDVATPLHTPTKFETTAMWRALVGGTQQQLCSAPVRTVDFRRSKDAVKRLSFNHCQCL
jgi:hypothetical protein